MKRSTLFPLMAVLAVAQTSGAAVNAQPQPVSRTQDNTNAASARFAAPAPSSKPTVGSYPPQFQINDIYGNQVTMNQFRGKVVLLDFWATWCVPCRREIPYIVSAYLKYHDQGLEIFGFSDDLSSDRDKVAAFMRENSMGWDQAIDVNQAISTLYGAETIPFSVLVGRDGKVAAVGMREFDYDPAIAKALAAK